MSALVHNVAHTQILNQAIIDGRQKANDDYDDAYDKAARITIKSLSGAEIATVANSMENPVETWQKLDTKYIFVKI